MHWNLFYFYGLFSYLNILKNPGNCASAKYFVLPNGFSGEGSLIHRIAVALAISLNLNRVLLVNQTMFESRYSHLFKQRSKYWMEKINTGIKVLFLCVKNYVWSMCYTCPSSLRIHAVLPNCSSLGLRDNLYASEY